MKMKLSSSAKILLFSSIIMVTILGGGLLINWVSSEKPFQSFPAVENQLVRIDEYDGDWIYTRANFENVIDINRYIVIQTSFGGTLVALSLNEVIISEDELAQRLRLDSAADLYLSNGSAKVIWGYNWNPDFGRHYVVKSENHQKWYMRIYATIFPNPEELIEWESRLLEISV